MVLAAEKDPPRLFTLDSVHSIIILLKHQAHNSESVGLTYISPLSSLPVTYNSQMIFFICIRGETTLQVLIRDSQTSACENKKN